VLDGCEPVLELVEPPLQSDDVRLSQDGGLDRVGRLVDERRGLELERPTPVGERVSWTSRSAAPRETSSSETICSS
jgi:hypothetical protein